MSVLSDNTIEKLCTIPTLVFDAEAHQEALKRLHVVPLTEFTRPLTDEEKDNWRPMIDPYVPQSVRTVPNADLGGLVRDQLGIISSDQTRKVLSFGTSSCGYDVQLTDELQLFTNIHSAIIDPKRIDTRCLVDAAIHEDPDGALYAILPPNSYMLGKTVEYFRIPRNIMVVCVGKSTYARSGIHINVTPIEPGFHGNIVIEISNGTSLPAKIYIHEGIAQFLFHNLDQPCKTSYADRGGKYQGQTTLQLPKV